MKNTIILLNFARNWIYIKTKYLKKYIYIIIKIIKKEHKPRNLYYFLFINNLNLILIIKSHIYNSNYKIC